MENDNIVWLKNTPVAHRGLWGNGVPENSLISFDAAAKAGFAIETDIYMTTDGVPVCFHDKTLDRTTDGTGFIYEKSYAELSMLSLKGGGKIPTLKELLETVNGRTPLLIEIKDQPNGKTLISAAVNILKKYDGAFAVQAFNPFYLNRVKKLAPKFTRGILSSENPDHPSALTRFVVKNMAFNFLCKPQFISFSHTGLPLKKRKIKGRPVLAWTVTSKDIYDKIKPHCDNIIFEYFIPEK